jgi:hypothetical protein
MADTKISAFTHATTVDAAADLVPYVDVSDTTQGPGGSTKYVFPSQLWPTTFAASAITSGQVALARGGTGADLSATGGAGKFVKQTSAGGVFTVDVIAASELPTTGLTIDSSVASIGAATDGTTVTFDLAAHSKWKVTLGGNRTLALSNPTASSPFTIALTQDGTGSRTVTWFSGISWSGGTAPTLTTTAGKTDVFTFLTISAGVYLGFVAGQNF